MGLTGTGGKAGADSGSFPSSLSPSRQKPTRSDLLFVTKATEPSRGRCPFSPDVARGSGAVAPRRPRGPSCLLLIASAGHPSPQLSTPTPGAHASVPVLQELVGQNMSEGTEGKPPGSDWCPPGPATRGPEGLTGLSHCSPAWPLPSHARITLGPVRGRTLCSSWSVGRGCVHPPRPGFPGRGAGRGSPPPASRGVGPTLPSGAQTLCGNTVMKENHRKSDDLRSHFPLFS